MKIEQLPDGFAVHLTKAEAEDLARRPNGDTHAKMIELVRKVVGMCKTCNDTGVVDDSGQWVIYCPDCKFGRSLAV